MSDPRPPSTGPDAPPGSLAATASDEEERPARIALHLKLADAAQDRGELALALSHYERVLAWQIDHPRARTLAASLRAELSPAHLGAAPATLALREGALGPIATRYRILREIGRGGAGTVYLAEDLHLERRVAIKVLHRRPGAVPGRLAGMPEARLIGALSTPGVVRILDLDARRGVVVMEHLAGGSLRDRLASRLPFPETAVRRLAVGLLETLAFVHRGGVIHGDLKPANVLYRRGGDPLEETVLADFGVATRQASSAEPAPDRLPLPRAGTLGYTAPEIAAGAPSDARADLYTLGVLLRECLLGRAPFDHARLLAGDRVCLEPLPERCPPDLQRLLSRLGARDPQDRPKDALEAASLLSR